MSKRRVVLGASIVGVVGAAALAAVVIDPQAQPGSAAGSATTTSGVEAAATTDPRTADPPTTAAAPTTDPPTADAPTTEPPVPEPASATTLAAPSALAFAFADPATCPVLGHAAVVDRDNQRAWLCADGAVTREIPITSAWSQPDPGDYAVYAKDMFSSSTFSGRNSTMTHFVAFTYGKFRGARIAFHSVPTYADGSYVQPLASVGAADQRGNSAGCIRVLPADAEQIWTWLEVGDLVRVVS